MTGTVPSVTYGKLNHALQTITAALAEIDLPPGSLVAVFHENPWVHLLLVLGFECLGMVVGQFNSGEGQRCAPLLADSALVVTSDAALPDRRHGVVRITPDWWQMIFSAGVGPGSGSGPWRTAADDPVLLNRSSGTTGQPKRMVITRRMLDIRIRQRSRLMGLTRRTRCLVTMPMNVAGSYYNIVACLRLGAVIVQPTSSMLWQDLVQHRITHATLLPLQLERLLVAAPANAAPLPDLTLCVIGARLTSDLRRRALDRICGHAVSVYSSNETGTVCVVRPDGEGELAPGIQVEIVDEMGRHLGHGQAGQLRIKGEGVVAGYVDQGVHVSRPFQDGWFQSGDVAMLTQAGGLTVLGRFDDLLNLDGIKVPCSDVEAKIMAEVPVREVAVFMHDDATDGQTLVVCAVLHSPCNVAAVHEAMRSAIARRFCLWSVDAIPRTSEGKIRRRELREMIRR